MNTKDIVIVALVVVVAFFITLFIFNINESDKNWFSRGGGDGGGGGGGGIRARAEENLAEVVEEEIIENVTVEEVKVEHTEILREKILSLDPPGEYAFTKRGTVGFNEVYSFGLDNNYFLWVLVDELKIFSSLDELAFLSEDNEFFENIFFHENPELVEKVRDASSVREVVRILNEGGFEDIGFLEKGTYILNYGWDCGELKVFPQTLQRDRFVLFHKGEPVILASCGNPILIPEPEPLKPDPIPDPIPDPTPDPIPEPTPDPTPDPDPDPTPDPDPDPKPDPEKPGEPGEDPDPGPPDEKPGEPGPDPDVSSPDDKEGGPGEDPE